MKDTIRLRQSIIDGCLWMGQAGLNQGTSGNISIRVDDGILITPSAVPYAYMTPDMICKLPLDGAPPVDARPSTEWPFHQAILAARPDAHAVVHAHPVHATTLAIQRRAIPAIHYMIAAFGGPDIPVAGYALFGSDGLSKEVTTALAVRHGCLMANHGAITLGDTLARALWRMQELETLAHQLILTDAGPAPAVLTDVEVEETIAAFADYGLRAPEVS